MKDAFRSIKGIEQKLRTIIGPDSFRRNMILCVNEIDEIFNMLRHFRFEF